MLKTRKYVIKKEIVVEIVQTINARAEILNSSLIRIKENISLKPARENVRLIPSERKKDSTAIITTGIAMMAMKKENNWLFNNFWFTGYAFLNLDHQSSYCL